jgi:hypothetical protein
MMHCNPKSARLLLAGCALAVLPVTLPARNVEGISDNSFFIEEAYNQERGVVQHIFTLDYGELGHGPTKEKAWNLSFTQEWPAPSQTHQLSYTIPYSFVEESGVSRDGVGDIVLHYRYQAYFDEKSLTAFAPSFSLVLPTGDEDRGFGENTLGYQLNLPFSTTFGDKWFAHANAGMTFLPGAGPKNRDLLDYNLGASLIYAATENTHFLLEWIGLWNKDSDSGDREFETRIAPGVRHAWNIGEAQLVLGAAAPVGLSSNTPDIGAFFYVSFEHAFRRSKE